MYRIKLLTITITLRIIVIRAYGSKGNFFFPEDYEIAVNELLYLEGLLKVLYMKQLWV